MTTTAWRPQLLWLPMGLVLGGLSGAALGAQLLLGMLVVEVTTAEGASWFGVGDSLVVGAWFGGAVGLAAGLAVGTLLALLVGAHLSREDARRRAWRLGVVLPPAVLYAALAAVGGGLAPLEADGAWLLLVLAGASVLGGPLARWVAGFQPPDLREIHQ